MNGAFSRWDVGKHLRTHEDVRLYLEACANEISGDGSLIRAALNHIAQSQDMSRLAHEISMYRKGPNKALSKNGNPAFATAMRVTRALGMQVRIAVWATSPHSLRLLNILSDEFAKDPERSGANEVPGGGGIRPLGRAQQSAS